MRTSKVCESFIGLLLLLGASKSDALGQEPMHRVFSFPQSMDRSDLGPILSAFKVPPLLGSPTGYKRRIVELRFFPTSRNKAEWLLHLEYESADGKRALDVFEALKHPKQDSSAHMFPVEWDATQAQVDGLGRNVIDQIYASSGAFDLMLLTDSLSRAQLDKALEEIVKSSRGVKARPRTG